MLRPSAKEHSRLTECCQGSLGPRPADHAPSVIARRRPSVGYVAAALNVDGLTCSFVAEVTATFKAVRLFLRANPAVQQQGCPYPQYSPDFERMIAFVQRLRGRLATTR